MLAFFAALGGAPVPVHGQAPPLEVAELRRRVAIMRHNLPDITVTAEAIAAMMTSDTNLRFLLSSKNDPGLFREFSVRAGGPPETGDAEQRAAHGIVLLPVRDWDRGALGATMQVDSWRPLGRMIVTLGSKAGKTSLPVGDRLVDNGAPDGSVKWADINGVANMIAAWTLYAEFVAAATRHGWQPGVYLPDAAPGGVAHNRTLRFHMPPNDAVPAMPAGRNGAAFLDAIDSLLDRAAVPSHQDEVTRMGDSLRSWRMHGARLFSSSCGHYLIEELPRPVNRTPFQGIDWRWDVPAKLKEAKVRPGDAILWFGYAGYDCPHAAVSDAFANAGLRVAIVSDRLDDTLPREVQARVALHWPTSDAVVPLPFRPGMAAPTSSIDQALHYLWLKRLVADSTTSHP